MHFQWMILPLGTSQVLGIFVFWKLYLFSARFQFWKAKILAYSGGRDSFGSQGDALKLFNPLYFANLCFAGISSGVSICLKGNFWILIVQCLSKNREESILHWYYYIQSCTFELWITGADNLYKFMYRRFVGQKLIPRLYMDHDVKFFS